MPFDLQEYNVNHSTGEVVPYEDNEDGQVAMSDPVMRSIVSGKTPMHLQSLIDKHGNDLESIESEYNLFTGIETESFDAYINTDINVLGVAFIPHAEFIGKDHEHHDGYWKCHILTDQKDRQGNLIVLGVSGVNIMPHMALAIKTRGWYLWDKPVKYRITKGSKSGAYFMKHVHDKPSTSATRVSESKA